MEPTSGTVKLFGEEVTGMKEREILRIRLRFGMLFQSGALLASLTVGENVALPLLQHSGGAVPQRLLRRDRPAVLGLARRGLRPGGVARLGADELRQGRAGPGHGGLARRGAGALPRRAGRRRVSGARCAASPSARSRHRATRRRRRRRSPASARSCRASRARARRRRRRSTTRGLDPRRPRRAHRQRRHERPLRRRACATSRRAPTRARGRPPRRRAGAASTRACPSPRRRRRTTASTPATAALDPAVAGAALRAAFAACAERGLEAFGVWTAGDVETAIASSAGRARCATRSPTPT